MLEQVEGSMKTTKKKFKIVICEDGIIVWHGVRGHFRKLTWRSYKFDDYELIEAKHCQICQMRNKLILKEPFHEQGDDKDGI